ncbi:MAG TPA: hypothetical protein VFE73_19375 [Reyranella sp.]|jgi:hypothetical protein|nr:hypothetical protein [Reyranella sp.]
MNGLAVPVIHPDAVAGVRDLERHLLALPQTRIETHHLLHGGMYARTILIPAGTALTGALIRVPTVLVIAGDTLVTLGNESVRLTGYHVLPAAAGRKTAFATIADTYVTMIFPTAARRIEEAEAEFTEEADGLCSRRDPTSNHVVITGE